MASYYKIVNGRKYDRSLLEFAESLTQGRGDGRISEQDAAQLLRRARDGWRITLIEERTLAFLLEELAWTDKALDWWKAHWTPPAEAEPTLEELLTQVIRREYRLEGLQWVVNEADVAQQHAIEPRLVPFATALREAVRCFLFDEDDYETPRNLVREVHGYWPDQIPDAEARLYQHLLDYLNAGTLFLLPLFSEELTEEERDALPFYPPEWGERPEQNWLFGLRLPTLSDHLYWAVVDRSGRRASYCYGFN